MIAPRCAVPLLAFYLQASPSAAQQPGLLPTRDVDVTYRSEQAGQVFQQRSRFSAETQRMRVDAPTPGVYTIMDYRTHAMAFISDADHAALETTQPPAPARAAPPPSTRRGDDTVAGLACTEYETLDNQGHPTLACFTSDGVMLRARRGSQVLAVATQVRYGPLPPDLFAIPHGYERLTRKTAR